MRQIRRKQAGVAAVEFAILLIPLLALLTGVTEFGRAMYYYNTLTKAARDATRLMSTQTPTDPDYATLLSNATCLAVYGNSACTGSPIVPGLTTAMVDLCDRARCPSTHENVATGSGVINLVTITIGSADNPYFFVSMAPFVPANFGIASFNFAPISVTMRQIL